MSIRQMTDRQCANEPNVETITNYPGHETTRIMHHYNCPHRYDVTYDKSRGPNCHEQCVYHEPIYMHTTYQGCVLAVYERNGYDDSDFYAVVWDEESKTIKDVQYATTRGWSYPNSAQVDATEEVKEKAQLYLQQQQFKSWQEHNVKQSKRPYIGRIVKVISGRKIPKGTIAEVFWYGEDQYARSRFDRAHRYNPYAGLVAGTIEHRCGLKWTDEQGAEHKGFTSEKNVEVINPEQYLKPEEEGRKLTSGEKSFVDRWQHFCFS